MVSFPISGEPPGHQSIIYGITAITKMSSALKRPNIAIVINEKELIEFKLKCLREEVESDEPRLVRQRPNIRFLIHHYENGGGTPPPGQEMWLKNGVVVDGRPPLDEWTEPTVPIWRETVCHPPLL